MTISFICPTCDELIAFDSKYAGKRAHCQTCGQAFIIPSKNNEKPKKIDPEPEICEPIPGFYRAALADSAKLFTDPENLITLIFVVAVVGFKFFLGRGVCCMNYVSFIVIWGWLFGFYLNIIYETAFDSNKLPEIYLGTSITFLWEIIRPFLIFTFTLFVVLLPFFIALSLFGDKGLTMTNFWTSDIKVALLLKILFVAGLFCFPMAILITAIAKDFTMLLRPDYILAPILRAPASYILVVVLLITACVLEIQANQFDGAGKVSIRLQAARLGLNLGVQIIAIIAMRSIGLFHRHYHCYLRW